MAAKKSISVTKRGLWSPQFSREWKEDTELCNMVLSLLDWKPKEQLHIILDLPLVRCFLLPDLSLPSGDDTSSDRVCNIFGDTPSPHHVFIG